MISWWWLIPAALAGGIAAYGLMALGLYINYLEGRGK
jgi:hypothetical protein